MASQRVFEGKWRIPVEDSEEVVTQLFCGRDFQAAFFKARAWAKLNVDTGELVSFVVRPDMVV